MLSCNFVNYLAMIALQWLIYTHIVHTAHIVTATSTPHTNITAYYIKMCTIIQYAAKYLKWMIKDSQQFIHMKLAMTSFPSHHMTDITYPQHSLICHVMKASTHTHAHAHTHAQTFNGLFASVQVFLMKASTLIYNCLYVFQQSNNENSQTAAIRKSQNHKNSQVTFNVNTKLKVLYLINPFAIEVHQSKTTLSHRITLKCTIYSIICKTHYMSMHANI